MKRSLFLTAFSFLVLAQLTWAQPPQTISYQGVLRDAGDLANGDYTLRFKLYDEGGTALGTPEWSEDHTTEVTDGIFSVVLGSITTFTSSAIYFNDPYWLEISIVDGTTVTTLPDRIQLNAAPYALKSGGVRGSDITFRPGSGGALGIGTLSPNANLQVVGNWTLGPSGTPPGGFDSWLSTNNGILYEGGGTGFTHHFSAYGGGDIARFGISTGVGLDPDTRVVIANSGNVGIGTPTPSAELDVAGNANIQGNLVALGDVSTQGTLTALGDVYSGGTITMPATTRWYSIPAREFLIIKGSINQNYDTVAYFIGGYADSEHKFSAGVHLPHGAVITELKAWMEDSSTEHSDSASFAIDLWELTPESTPASVASVITSGNTVGIQSQTDYVSQQVDNQNNTYLVTAVWVAPSYTNLTALKLYSVRITYTVTSPLP